MKARRRVVSGLCLLTGIFLAGYARFSWVRAHAPMPSSVVRLGKALPPLLVVDASGRIVDVGKASLGSRSVIVFYSASCRVCQAVLPELQPFPHALRLLLVSEEAGSSSEAPKTLGSDQALRFYDRNRVLSRSFSMSGLPTILFVDESGVLRDGLVGEHARGLLQKKLKEFSAGSP